MALAGRGSGFGRPIQRGERTVQITGLEVSVCSEAKPLRVEQVAAGPIPAVQAGTQLCDPIPQLAEADQSDAPAYDCLRKPLR